jgi:hypothetical protein
LKRGAEVKSNFSKIVGNRCVYSGMILNRIGTRHPEVASLAVHLHRWASLEGWATGVFILRGAQERAPQDNAIGSAASF